MARWPKGAKRLAFSVLIGTFTACAGSNTGPSPPAYTALSVHVYDALGTDVPGATIQIVGGAQSGLPAVTDATGTAVIAGTFGHSVTLRLSKIGFVSQTTMLFLTSGASDRSGVARLVITLEAPNLVQP